MNFEGKNAIYTLLYIPIVLMSIRIKNKFQYIYGDFFFVFDSVFNFLKGFAFKFSVVLKKISYKNQAGLHFISFIIEDEEVLERNKRKLDCFVCQSWA